MIAFPLLCRCFLVRCSPTCFFAFVAFAFGFKSKTHVKELTLFSSRSFMVVGFSFKCLIHFEFIFVYGVKECSNFILLHVAVHFSQHHLLKRLSLIHCIFLPLCHRLADHRCLGVISGLSILFHRSIFLFLCHYHTVLMTVAL